MLKLTRILPSMHILQLFPYVRRLEAALEFYAGAWRANLDPAEADWEPDDELRRNSGRRAREALPRWRP